MYLLRGKMYMESSEYNCAIQAFKDARVKLGSHEGQPPLIISLVYSLLPRNMLKLILICYRFQGGSLMILQSSFNSNCVRPSL